jgi:hypothetical protein
MWLRRIVVWSVLAAMIAALVLAMVIVWTANEREWYIDNAGIALTLNMTLSDTGRWLAIAVIGVLIALVVFAFVIELATGNSSKKLGRTGPVIPSLEARSPSRSIHDAAPPTGASNEAHSQRTSPAPYASTIAGDRDTRRVERSLPPRQ